MLPGKQLMRELNITLEGNLIIMYFFRNESYLLIMQTFERITLQLFPYAILPFPPYAVILSSP